MIQYYLSRHIIFVCLYLTACKDTVTVSPFKYILAFCKRCTYIDSMGKWCAFNPSRSVEQTSIRIAGHPAMSTMCFMPKSLIWCTFLFRQNSRPKQNIFYSSGAIRRMAVEKEPSISYESFVNELDTGDSFTLSLVDILVKVRRYFKHFPAALIV